MNLLKKLQKIAKSRGKLENITYENLPEKYKAGKYDTSKDKR